MDKINTLLLQESSLRAGSFHGRIFLCTFLDMLSRNRAAANAIRCQFQPFLHLKVICNLKEKHEQQQKKLFLQKKWKLRQEPKKESLFTEKLRVCPATLSVSHSYTRVIRIRAPVESGWPSQTGAYRAGKAVGRGRRRLGGTVQGPNRPVGCRSAHHSDQ